MMINNFVVFFYGFAFDVVFVFTKLYKLVIQDFLKNQKVSFWLKIVSILLNTLF